MKALSYLMGQRRVNVPKALTRNVVAAAVSIVDSEDIGAMTAASLLIFDFVLGARAADLYLADWADVDFEMDPESASRDLAERVAETAEAPMAIDMVDAADTEETVTAIVTVGAADTHEVATADVLAEAADTEVAVTASDTVVVYATPTDTEEVNAVEENRIIGLTLKSCRPLEPPPSRGSGFSDLLSSS